MRRLGTVRTKVVFWLAVASLGALAAVGSTASLTACGESGGCTKLRNDLYAEKATWDACDPAEGPLACIKTPGTSRDCTGVLSCDFAVNPHHRVEAEQVVLTVGERSRGCYLCATPNCVGGNIAYCEPVSRRCIIVTELIEAGPVFGGDIEAGSPVKDDAATLPIVDSGMSPNEASASTFDGALFSGH